MLTICAAIFCSIGLDVYLVKISVRVQRLLWNLHSPLSLPACVASELIKIISVVCAVRFMLHLPLDSVAIPLICLVDFIRGFLGGLAFFDEYKGDKKAEGAKVLVKGLIAGQGLMVLISSAYFLYSN